MATVDTLYNRANAWFVSRKECEEVRDQFYRLLSQSGNSTDAQLEKERQLFLKLSKKLAPRDQLFTEIADFKQKVKLLDKEAVKWEDRAARANGSDYALLLGDIDSAGEPFSTGNIQDLHSQANRIKDLAWDSLLTKDTLGDLQTYKTQRAKTVQIQASCQALANQVDACADRVSAFNLGKVRRDRNTIGYKLKQVLGTVKPAVGGLSAEPAGVIDLARSCHSPAAVLALPLSYCFYQYGLVNVIAEGSVLALGAAATLGVAAIAKKSWQTIHS